MEIIALNNSRCSAIKSTLLPLGHKVDFIALPSIQEGNTSIAA